MLSIFIVIVGYIIIIECYARKYHYIFYFIGFHLIVRSFKFQLFQGMKNFWIIVIPQRFYSSHSRTADHNMNKLNKRSLFKITQFLIKHTICQVDVPIQSAVWSHLVTLWK